jgi:inosine-uridine nucleoside N-ribohydrolase
VALGAFTNLALLEVLEPGCLRGVPIFATAGWLGSPGAGFPQWGPDVDFNVRCDPRAAQLVWDAEPALTLVAPTASIKAHLRAADLPRLKASGPLGELLARQGQAVAEQFGNMALGQAHAALPDDLLNFHWDSVTAAVAVGWPGCTLTEQRLTFDAEQPGFVPATSGRAVRVVTDIDAPGFRELWLRRVETLP